MAAPILFALSASEALGRRVAQALRLPLSPHEERPFEDGEHKSRPLQNVRERDVYVLQSLHGLGEQSVNDKLVRLLFFIGALKQSGVGRVTAVIPYLAYSRKDRRTKPNDPVTTRYMATLFEAVGTERLVTIDVHNLVAFQNAFRCEVEQLEARHLFATHLARELAPDETAVVLSPDVGGVKRADRFRESLQARLHRPVAIGFMEKRRSGGIVSGDRLVAEVAGRAVIIVDDLIAGGTTVARAADACRDAGAKRILVTATHALFTGQADETLTPTSVARFFVTDSAPLPNLGPSLQERIEVVGIAPFLAEAIRRLNIGDSLQDMAETY